jgi:hypothetical protein
VYKLSGTAELDKGKMPQQPNSAAMQPHVLFQQATTPTQSTVVTYKSEGNGCVEISGNGYQQTFSRLPRRTPVDIQFENIGFTASLGFRKGTIFNTSGSII